VFEKLSRTLNCILLFSYASVMVVQSDSPDAITDTRPNDLSHKLLQEEWHSSSEQQIVKFNLLIEKAILNLETKPSWRETADEN